MDYTFQGYVRPDGKVGSRNYVAVIPTVICATDVAQALIRDGLIAGTVRQSTKDMALALGTATKELLLGRSPANAVAAAAKLDQLFAVDSGPSNKLLVAYTSYP